MANGDEVLGSAQDDSTTLLLVDAPEHDDRRVDPAGYVLVHGGDVEALAEMHLGDDPGLVLLDLDGDRLALGGVGGERVALAQLLRRLVAGAVARARGTKRLTMAIAEAYYSVAWFARRGVGPRG